MTREVGDMGTPTVTRIFQLWSQDVGWYNMVYPPHKNQPGVLKTAQLHSLLGTDEHENCAFFTLFISATTADSLGEGKKP